LIHRIPGRIGVVGKIGKANYRVFAPESPASLEVPAEHCAVSTSTAEFDSESFVNSADVFTRSVDSIQIESAAAGYLPV
jgi:hypothetical protein